MSLHRRSGVQEAIGWGLANQSPPAPRTQGRGTATCLSTGDQELRRPLVGALLISRLRQRLHKVDRQPLVSSQEIRSSGENWSLGLLNSCEEPAARVERRASASEHEPTMISRDLLVSCEELAARIQSRTSRIGTGFCLTSPDLLDSCEELAARIRAERRWLARAHGDFS